MREYVKEYVGRAWKICEAEKDLFGKIDFPIKDNEYITVKFWGDRRSFTVMYSIYVNGMCYEEVIEES